MSIIAILYGAGALTPCLTAAPSVIFGGRSFDLPRSQQLRGVTTEDAPHRLIYESPESGERYVVVHHRTEEATDDAALLFARGYIVSHLERFRQKGRLKTGLLASRSYTRRKTPAILIATSRGREELCHHTVAFRTGHDVLLLAHEGTSENGMNFLKWARGIASETYGMELSIDLVALRQQQK